MYYDMYVATGIRLFVIADFECESFILRRAVRNN